MSARRARHILVVLGMAVVIAGAGCTQDSEQAVSGLPGTNAPVVIDPNISVGKVHAGMTVQQLVAELGEPPRRTANALDYPRLGLAVMPNADGVVQVVMCGDVMGINGPYVKAFTGHTKEGIGMRATRGEVVKAYGEPAQTRKGWGGLETLDYKSLGIAFTLEGEKVCHMIVRLGGAAEPEPERTVTVDLVPEPARK